MKGMENKNLVFYSNDPGFESFIIIFLIGIDHTSYYYISKHNIQTLLRLMSQANIHRYIHIYTLQWKRNKTTRKVGNNYFNY